MTAVVHFIIHLYRLGKLVEKIRILQLLKIFTMPPNRHSYGFIPAFNMQFTTAICSYLYCMFGDNSLEYLCIIRIAPDLYHYFFTRHKRSIVAKWKGSFSRFAVSEYHFRKWYAVGF